MKADASDADDPETDNAALRYSILEPGMADTFTMDEFSGEIHTAHGRLDREVPTCQDFSGMMGTKPRGGDVN